MNGFIVPDPTTVAIECVVFAMVLVGLGRFVLPRLRAVVEAEQRQTLEAQRSALDAKARLDEATREARAVLQTARREARQIIDSGQHTHDRLVQEGRLKGHAEYEWARGRVAREASRRRVALHPIRRDPV